MAEMPEGKFRKMLEGKLGPLWPRALTLFKKFGPHFSFVLSGSLEDAAGQGRVAEVLEAIERYWISSASMHVRHLAKPNFEKSPACKDIRDFFLNEIDRKILGIE